jgi:hypothetical protein
MYALPYRFGLPVREKIIYRHYRFHFGLSLLLILLVLPEALSAGISLDDDGKVTLSGDFRFRIEHDWDSARANGSLRADRTRARVRARLGVQWRKSENSELGLRLRTGTDGSHQSPHITVIDFDDNDTGPADFNFDKWYLKGTGAKSWAWVGRNSFPFWKQNEMFWDDDATPTGIAAGWKANEGERGRVALNVGYFTLPVGMKAFAGNLAAGQAVYSGEAGTTGFTLAVGLFAFEANADDPDATLLRTGNGFRDYTIWVLGGQAKLSGGDRPLVFGLDAMHNTEDYGADDPYGFLHRNETDGFVASVKWGSTSNKGDWLLGYWYGEIEALAVNASYAQDDWVRWGSASHTDSSDLEGHELRFAYGLGGFGNLVARLYLVDAISSEQDGQRFRLDYNVEF